jgi:hypothetical protein
MRVSRVAPWKSAFICVRTLHVFADEFREGDSLGEKFAPRIPEQEDQHEQQREGDCLTLRHIQDHDAVGRRKSRLGQLRPAPRSQPVSCTSYDAATS